MSGVVVAAPIAVLVFRGLAVAALAGVAIQFFLAGMTVFGAGTGWETHAAMGGALGLPVIGLFLMSLSRGLRAYRRSAGLLLAVYLIQVMLAALGSVVPMLGALHPVNGLLMALITFQLVRRLTPRNGGSF
ncbi:MAG: DUF6220 domain-containing protein [Rhizobium sp.]|nr:DUF6220 domain-containing protein [Rhizobium sp.]